MGRRKGRSRGNRGLQGEAGPGPTGGSIPQPAPHLTLPNSNPQPPSTPPLPGAGTAGPRARRVAAHEHKRFPCFEGAFPEEFAAEAHDDIPTTPNNINNRQFNIWARVTCWDDPRTAQGAVSPPGQEPGPAQTRRIFQLQAPKLLDTFGQDDSNHMSLADVHGLREKVTFAYPNRRDDEPAHESQSVRDSVSGEVPRRKAWAQLNNWYPRLKDDYGALPEELRSTYQLDALGNVVALSAVMGSLCSFNMDHIFNWKRGGKSVESNLMALADVANNAKSAELWTFLVQWRSPPATPPPATDAIKQPNRPDQGVPPAAGGASPQGVIMGPLPSRVLCNFKIRYQGPRNKASKASKASSKAPVVLDLVPLRHGVPVSLFSELWLHLKAVAGAQAQGQQPVAGQLVLPGDAGPEHLLNAMLLRPWPELLRERHVKHQASSFTDRGVGLPYLAARFLQAVQMLGQQMPGAAGLYQALGGTPTLDAGPNAALDDTAVGIDQQKLIDEEEEGSGLGGEEEDDGSGGSRADDSGSGGSGEIGESGSEESGELVEEGLQADFLIPTAPDTVGRLSRDHVAVASADGQLLLRQLDALVGKSLIADVTPCGPTGPDLLTRLSHLLGQLQQQGGVLPQKAALEAGIVPHHGISRAPQNQQGAMGPLVQQGMIPNSTTLLTLHQALRTLQLFTQQQQVQHLASHETTQLLHQQHQQLQLWSAWYDQLQLQQHQLAATEPSRTLHMPAPPPGQPPALPRPGRFAQPPQPPCDLPAEHGLPAPFQLSQDASGAQLAPGLLPIPLQVWQQDLPGQVHSTQALPHTPAPLAHQPQFSPAAQVYPSTQVFPAANPQGLSARPAHRVVPPPGASPQDLLPRPQGSVMNPGQPQFTSSQGPPSGGPFMPSGQASCPMAINQEPSNAAGPTQNASAHSAGGPSRMGGSGNRVAPLPPFMSQSDRRLDPPPSDAVPALQQAGSSMAGLHQQMSAAAPAIAEPTDTPQKRGFFSCFGC